MRHPALAAAGDQLQLLGAGVAGPVLGKSLGHAVVLGGVDQELEPWIEGAAADVDRTAARRGPEDGPRQREHSPQDVLLDGSIGHGRLRASENRVAEAKPYPEPTARSRRRSAADRPR